MRGLLLLISCFTTLHLHAEEVASATATPPATEQAPKREPARIPTAAEAEEMNAGSRRNSHDISFFVGADVNFGGNIVFSNVDLSDGGVTYTGSAQMNANPAAAIRVGIEWLPINSFGFQASAAFETPRTVTAPSISLSGAQTIPSSINNATLQYNLIEITGAYRWRYLYLPIGINYSIPILSGFNGNGVTFTANGTVGGQMGAGLAIYGGLRVEVLLSLLGIQMRSTGMDAGLPYTYNYGSGYLTTGELRAHWTF